MGEYGEVVPLSPFFGGEKHGARAVREWSAVTRRQRPRAAEVERRAQFREFLDRAVRADVVVAGESAIRQHEIVVEAGAPRGGCLQMTLVRELVLSLARDLPALRHELGALSHGQPRARLDHTQHHRLEVSGTQSEERRHALGQGASEIALEQQLLVGAGVHDRRIADRIDTARESGRDLAQRALLAEENRGLEARAARALHVKPWGLRVESRGQNAFAHEVVVARMLDDGAGDGVPQALARELEALDDSPEGLGEHLLVADLSIGAVRARERQAKPADDGDASDR